MKTTTTKTTLTRSLATAALSLAAMLPLSTQAAVKRTWAPKNGDVAGIANPDNWAEGQVPVKGDVVLVNNSAVMEVNDDNCAFFSTFYEVVMSRGYVKLNTTTNATFGGVFQGNNSRVVKLGPAQFTCDGSGGSQTMQLTGGQFIVSNGVFTMKAQSNGTYPSVYKVFKPGVLEFSQSCGSQHFIAGLVGDGTVSNAVVSSGMKQIVFVTSRFNEIDPGQVSEWPPYVFTGDVVGTAPFTAGYDTYLGSDKYSDLGADGQFLLTSSASNLPYSSPRFNVGMLGISAIGGKAGAPSSLGNYDTLSFFCFSRQPRDTGFIYCGDGETTSRGFDMYFSKVGSRAVADGGANGGLNFTGEWKHKKTSTARADGTANRLVLAGSNSAPCVVNGKVTEECATNSLAIVKRGTGTWTMKNHAERNNKGVVLVEKGRLEFESIANAGTVCSLGTATQLSTNWFGVVGMPFVDFAYLLGDGTNAVESSTATMSYVGAANAFCTNRPFAVKGAGRVTSADDAGKMRLVGAFSAQEGVNSLVLGGAGSDNCFRDVTNGVGQLKVVKEGTGTWRLTGDVKLGGGVEVKEGTLRISNRYTWYRMNLRETFDLGTHKDAKYNKNFGFKMFAMWDDDGNLLTRNFTEKSQSTDVLRLNQNETQLGCSVAITPSSAARGWAGAFVYSDVSDPLNPTAGGLFRVAVNASGSTIETKLPKEDRPDTWLRYVMRFPCDSAPAACYDMRAEENTSNINRNMEMKSFSMDASADGVCWTTVSDVTNSVPSGNLAYCYWYSTRGTARTKSDGFRLSATRGANPVEVASVSVASGATLDVEPEANVVVSGFAYDVTKGGGTVKGVSLAADGVISVSGPVAAEGRTSLAMNLSDVGGLANANGWSVEVNGVPKPAWRARATAAGFTVAAPGTAVLVR